MFNITLSEETFKNKKAFALIICILIMLAFLVVYLIKRHNDICNLGKYDKTWLLECGTKDTLFSPKSTQSIPQKEIIPKSKRNNPHETQQTTLRTQTIKVSSNRQTNGTTAGKIHNDQKTIDERNNQNVEVHSEDQKNGITAGEIYNSN